MKFVVCYADCLVVPLAQKKNKILHQMFYNNIIIHRTHTTARIITSLLRIKNYYAEFNKKLKGIANVIFAPLYIF